MPEFIVLILLPLISSSLCYLVKNPRAQFILSLTVSSLHFGLSSAVFFGYYNANLPFFFCFDPLNTFFLSAGNIHGYYRTREVDKITSVLNVLPISGWLFLLSFLAISGIPPFGIFFSEIKIFEGILFSDHPGALLLTLFFLLFIFINMGNIILKMLYKNSPAGEPQMKPEKFTIIHLSVIILLILLVVLAVFSDEIFYENIFNIAKDFGMTV